MPVSAPPAAHGQLLTAAERFITLFHAENPRAGSVAGRMRQILAEVAAHGTCRHTPEELTFAAGSPGGPARGVSAGCWAGLAR
jgi:nitric-oxide synthase